MIKVTQKYQLTFATIRLAPHLKTQLPAWYHPNVAYRPMSNPTTKCLIQAHNVSTITDMLKMSARLRNPMHPRPHEPNPWCLCQDCIHNQINIKCRDAHKCASKAQERLRTIFPKMNPLHHGGWHGDLSLTSA